MSTLQRPRVPFNSATLAPAAWHALAVAARKPSADRRDELAAGAYPIDATIRVCGTLTVGHDSETAATVTPSLDALLATILGKLNHATREAVTRQILEDATANGGDLPDADAESVEAAGDFLAKLRRRVPQSRRGSVTGQFTVETVPIDRSGRARSPRGATGPRIAGGSRRAVASGLAVVG